MRVKVRLAINVPETAVWTIVTANFFCEGNIQRPRRYLALRCCRRGRASGAVVTAAGLEVCCRARLEGSTARRGGGVVVEVRLFVVGVVEAARRAGRDVDLRRVGQAERTRRRLARSNRRDFGPTGALVVCRSCGCRNGRSCGRRRRVYGALADVVAGCAVVVVAAIQGLVSHAPAHAWGMPVYTQPLKAIKRH